MTHRLPCHPVVDLDSLPDDLDADATQFIRISGPPKRPARPAPAAPRRAPAVPQQVQQTRPPPAPVQPVVSPPRVVGPPPLSGPPSASPFRVVTAAPAPSPAPPGGQGLTVIVCVAMVCLALVAIAGALSLDRSGPVAGQGLDGPRVAEAGVAVAGLSDDSGFDEEEEEEEVDEDREADQPPVGSGSPVVRRERPPPPPSVGTLEVHLPDPKGVTRMAVTCSSGFEGRSAYGGSPHVVAAVPTGEPCTLHFRGASPYRFHGARGGQSLTCTFTSGVAACQ